MASADSLEPSSRAQAHASEARPISAHDQLRRRAERRVAEYLRVHGLRDAQRLNELASELVATCEAAGELLPTGAIALAQARVESFTRALWQGRQGALDALWLRAFVEAHPECFLGSVEAARAAAQAFGDPERGEPPRTGRFAPQVLAPARWPSWLRGLALPALATIALGAAWLVELSRDGLSALELLWALCFLPVFALPAIGCMTAWLGARAACSSLAPEPEREAQLVAALPKSVVVVPIYHESAEQVFARVAAMRESLASTPGGDAFDVFVLCDSVDPVCVADEERAFRRISALEPQCERVCVFYRRRRINARQKAGNLAEFFERFGGIYTYAVVLDADSLMSGAAMVELARRMEGNPRVGLIQARLTLHAGKSLLARCQQWLTSVCGPGVMRGAARWAGPAGNYYGHNAIVRVSAFLECCALPVLPGAPPFGGPFLSHDFVEAALLCRGGWEVRAACDLAESWEEMPQSLPEYVVRDRRWCQGNLQHARIVLAQGLRPMSRIHLSLGILSYLAGPALLVFLALGALVASTAQGPVLPGWLAATSIGAALVCLAAPRVLGIVETLRERASRELHGGAARVMLSALAELASSSVLAPLLLLHHVRAIGALTAGKSVTWGARARDGGTSLAEIARIEAPAMVLGAGLLLVLLRVAPALVPWLAPMWLPWCLSLPIGAALSSERLGVASKRLGLFLTPSELAPSALAVRARELRALTTSDEAARFRDLVLDPVILAAHLAKLPADSRAPSSELDDARERAMRMGPAALSSDERTRLSADAASMQLLHREAWLRWPIESWDLGRRAPQTPPSVAALPAQVPTNQRRTG